MIGSKIAIALMASPLFFIVGTAIFDPQSLRQPPPRPAAVEPAQEPAHTAPCVIGKDAANPGCQTEDQMIAQTEADHIQKCLNNPNGWFCGDVNSQPHILILRPLPN